MGGPKRVALVLAGVVLVLAALMVLWFSTLKPEVRQVLLGNVLPFLRG